MESQDGYLNAYRIFKRLTWDYPSSKWAKYARGRLTEDQFQTMEEE
jgi:outer membrane protein assembly factor BamD (BamD/ComL family)